MRRKIIRITTVPVSLKVLLRGQLKFVNNHYDVIAVSSSGPELTEVEELEGIRTYPVEMSRKISPFRDILSICRLYKIFKKETPQIVHTHTPKAGFVAITAAFLAGVPNRLHTVAGLPLMETKGIKRIILLVVERFTYRLSTIVLPNSAGLRNFILSNRLTANSKLRILGNGSSNGINLEYFKTSESVKEQSDIIKEKYGLNGRFIYLFIGRLVSHKGLNELVSSFMEISKKFPQTVLLLVGEFEDNLDPLSADTRRNMSHASIIHVGYQSDIRPFLEISDVFVFPSYREGFPNVVLQACAFNLPCIVTDISGSNEIIKNNENGLIVDPKDEKKLINAMELLYTDSNLRKVLGEKNRIIIENKFDQTFVWGNLINLYDSL